MMTAKLQSIIRRISRESLAPRWRRLRPFYLVPRKAEATPDWVEVFATGFAGETVDTDVSPTLGGTCPPGVTIEADFGLSPRCIEGGMGEDGRTVRYPTMTEAGGGSYNNQFRAYMKWSSAALTQNNLARRGKSQQWVFVPSSGGPMCRTSGETYYFTCAMWVLDDGAAKMHVVGFNAANQLGIWIGLDRSADWSGTAPDVTLEVDAEAGSWNRLTVEWEIGPDGTGYFKLQWLSGDGDGASVTWSGDTRLAFWNATLCLAHAGGTGDNADDSGYFGVLDSVTVWAPQAEEWHAVVNQWAARVLANGGPQPSGATRRALDVFYRGLEQEGLAGKMSCASCFVPDSLTAAITPLIKGAGSDPWTNYNFTGAALSVNGLVSNGTNQYLATGIFPASEVDADHFGVSIYHTTQPTNIYAVGVRDTTDASVNRLSLQPSTGSGANTALLYGAGTGAAASTATGIATGYLCASRTASNNLALFGGNSATAFALLAQNVFTNTSSPPVKEVFVFAENYTGSSALPCGVRLSYVAFHAGLTYAESAAEFGLVQALRRALGGGYV